MAGCEPDPGAESSAAESQSAEDCEKPTSRAADLRPEPEPEPGSERKPEPEPEPKPKSEPAPEPPESEPAPAPKPESEAVESAIEPEPERVAVPEPQPEVAPEPETKPEAESEIAAEAEPAVVQEPKTEAIPIVGPESLPESGSAPEPEFLPEPESVPEPELTLEPELAPEPEIVSEPEPIPDPEPAIEPKSTPEPKPVSKLESILNPESASKLKSASKPEFLPESESPLEPELDKSESLLKSESLSEPESRLEAESLLKPESLSEPESLPEPESLSKPETLLKPEALSKPETLLKPESLSKPEILLKPESLLKPAIVSTPDKRPESSSLEASPERARTPKRRTTPEPKTNIRPESALENDQKPEPIARPQSQDADGKRQAPSSREPNEACPTKKVRRDAKPDSILAEYLTNLPNLNDEDAVKHVESLVAEIETLRELADAKELEWNQLIHLRKVKEEILLRLLRKKTVSALERLPAESKASERRTEDPNDELARIERAERRPTPASNGAPVAANPIYCRPNNSYGFDPYGGANKVGAKPSPPMVAPRASDYEAALHASKYSSPMGRQGPIKDVQSIIADYRQKHPEEPKVVQRRGRRLRSQTPLMGQRMPAPHPDQPQPTLAEMGLIFGGVDPNLAALDNVVLQQNAALLGHPAMLPNGMSFKDVLTQFVSLTGGGGQPQPGCPPTAARLPPPPPYPEVTLHPVGASSQQFPMKISQHHQQQLQQQQQQQQHQNNNSSSLLHGILTKSQPRQDTRFSSFSPTLAKLLTAPEKNLPANNTCRAGNLTNPINNFMMPKQTSSEITITAVQPQNNSSNNNGNHGRLQQQQQQQQEVVQLDDFEEAELEDDAADRPLVIDEGNNARDPNGSLEVAESEVPECQGCRKREAQFVCAGCANQWYCSRECQVSAWDEHSEVCSG